MWGEGPSVGEHSSRRSAPQGSASCSTLPARWDEAGHWPRSRAAPWTRGSVPKYVTPLLIPPVMPRAGTITMPGGKPADYYEISMRQFTQQILPAGMPATTVWGYGAVKSASKKGSAAPPRALAHDRGEVEPAGAGQVDQRAGGRERQLPAAPAAGRSDAALGEPAGRRRRGATRGRRSTRHPGRTPVRCRS